MSKKIDMSALTPVVGTMYPPPYDEPCLSRERIRLGDAAGLTQFGVNLLRLPPGAWSSQRHWHTETDEFIYVVSGEVTLVTNDGPESCAPATQQVSRQMIQTATACQIDRRRTPLCSRSERGRLMMPAIIRMSTC
jgi:hypothetical protein